MLRVIHIYDSSGSPMSVCGQSLPALALVEHEDDACRWLLLSSAELHRIPAYAWHHAHAAGAVGILANLADGIAATTTDQFAADRTEFPGGYSISFGFGNWSTFTEAPTYLQAITTRTGLHSSEPPMANKQRSSGFVHLHTHSEYSAFDGFSTVGEAVRAAAADGQEYMGLTDHGTCAGHPVLQRECDRAGIRPVFGIEANFVADRLVRPAPAERLPKNATPEQQQAAKDHRARERARIADYWHLCLYAQNDTGLRNIWAASTESNRDGFYGRPRMDWDTLERHSEGVIVSTGCLRGPLATAILAGDEDAMLARLARLQDIFGDRLYVELHANSLAKQQLVNHHLVEIARTHSLPLLAVVDAHYPAAADHDAHQIWISCQTNKEADEEKGVFADHLELHMQTEAEVRANLAYLGPGIVDEAISQTVELARSCTARITGTPQTPIFTRQGTHAHDADRLHTLCMQNWDRLPITTPDEEATYRQRYETEMSLLVDKQFCGYYLIVADYCGWAKDHGILVGPGRGSGGGSLVAYLARITSLDPIRHGLLFERFLTRGRHGLPDFDVDFPASKKAQILGYLRHRYGAHHVVSIGTELRLKNKAVINELARALVLHLPVGAQADLRRVCTLIDEAEAGSAGLGLSWDDLWTQHEEQLRPYAERYPELFALATQFVGRLKSYGRHAAGVIISTGDPLTDRLPLRRIDGEDEQMASQFAMGDVEDLGFVKFDILTLRTLDTVQQALDLILEQRAMPLDLERFNEEFEDPQVWQELTDGRTLGVFQVETHAGTRLTQRMKPSNLAELTDMITLVRPGPTNSGLTDAYLTRRSGTAPVTYPDERLRAVLEPTWGAMIFQEQVMAVTRILAGYDEEEADAVRSILGKKKVEKVAAAGAEFTSRADMPPADAARLWAQMAEFSKYSFNKSHAVAYAYLAYWTLWLRVHYPVEFLTAALSTVDTDRIPAFIKEARRLGIKVLPPDINASGSGFTPDGNSVRYGLDSVNGIGTSVALEIIAGQPYASWEDFQERKGPKTVVNAGVVALLARIGAFDSLVPNRRGLEASLLAKKTGEDARCAHWDAATSYPLGQLDGVQVPQHCGFDWLTEPPPVNSRTGKHLKPKKPPKRCTVACRQYTPRPSLRIDAVTPYTEQDIRDIEYSMLGIHLTTTPFDTLGADDRANLRAVAEHLPSAPNGSYLIGAIVSRVRAHPTKDMGFLTLETETSEISCAVFSETWAEERPRLVPGQLCIAALRKTDRGLHLTAYQPL